MRLLMGETRRAVICYIPRDSESLMIHRNGAKDFLRGTITAPGGGIKFGERPIRAAYRESGAEETGLELKNVFFRGTVLYDHSDRPEDRDDLNYPTGINHSVDIFCAGNFSRNPYEVCESGPLIWTPNSDIPRLSKWNGGNLVLDWLRDGRLFDAHIKHRVDGRNNFSVMWTSEDRVSNNPYRK